MTHGTAGKPDHFVDNWVSSNTTFYFLLKALPPAPTFSHSVLCPLNFLDVTVGSDLPLSSINEIKLVEKKSTNVFSGEWQPCLSELDLPAGTWQGRGLIWETRFNIHQCPWSSSDGENSWHSQHPQLCSGHADCYTFGFDRQMRMPLKLPLAVGFYRET